MARLTVCGQPQFRVMRYDDFNSTASSVSRIVRDGQGMMWFGTRDGLYRYDGYEFRSFKSHSGDGINMTSNRISGMYASSEGAIWCMIDDRVFLFDLRTYRYIDVMADFEQQQGRSYKIEKIRPLPCGITWLFSDDGQMLAVDDAQAAASVRLMATDEDIDHMTVSCDPRQRSWILTGKHTYLYMKGGLTTFDQVFKRIIYQGDRVWLLAGDGSFWLYDETTHQVKAALRPSTPIVNATLVGTDTLALFLESGLNLLLPDGKTVRPTNINWPVRKLMQDNHGRLWILGSDGRLCVSNSQCQQVTEIAGVRTSDCFIHSDKFGTLWFFTKDAGVYYAATNTPTSLHRFEQAESIPYANTIADGQGGCWFISNERACRLTFEAQHYEHLPLQKAGQVRSLWRDARQRLFVATRGDEAVTVFAPSGERMGWLTADGRISPAYTSFGASIYAAYTDVHGTLWLGSKRHGVFRLRLQPDGNFQTDNYKHDEQQPSTISDNEVYDFAEDTSNRLWIATRHGGLCCLPDPTAPQPRFVHAANGLKGWEADTGVGVSSLLATKSGVLLVGTFSGLYVANVVGADLSAIRFTQHTREANRRESLSNSVVTDIVMTNDGRLFLSTEGGGVNEVVSTNLLAAQLEFRHHDTSTGFPADIIRNMAEYNGSLWVSAPDRLVEMRRGDTDLPDINSYLMTERPYFSASSPVQLKGGRWVYGADDGALLIDLDQLRGSSFVPPLVVTGVSIENRPIDYAASWSDTITLAPREHSLTLWFSALDYEDAKHVLYAYRMGDDNSPWIYTGQNHSIALAQLKPGTYQVTLRSTNSDGVWCNNLRTLTIVVQPTFWETPWAVVLISFIILLVVSLVGGTWWYIHRIKRQQRETMEAYLSLLESKSTATTADVATADDNQPVLPDADPQPTTTEVGHLTSEEDDALMKRLMNCIESNLSNSDATIDDIASACAVSRTSLHRKVKHLMGTSPMELLREARIRKSYQLLSTTSKTISEVAFECGFSDPKYFSKCFKAATGKTPTEFKRQQ